jgi:hypothetical protein
MASKNNWKAAKPAKWHNIPEGDSESLSRFGYNGVEQTLTVKFSNPNSKEYNYFPVQRDTFITLRTLIGSAYLGEIFRELIRSTYLNGDDGLQYSVREK